MKRFIFSIFFILFFTQAVFSQDVFKVTSVNFDESNSFIFLTSPDETSDAIIKNVKLYKLQNPKRVYFDINSAILTTPAQNWFLSSGGVKQVKVNQFSTNPNKIRVLLYLEDDFDPSKISFYRVSNNLIIKLNNGKNICNNNYFQNTYSDERKSSKDFYENLSISNFQVEKLKTATNETKKDDLLNQIQNAFESTNSAVSKNLSNTQDINVNNELIKKELKLRSKYYINQITAKENGFLISGFGAASIEKPMYLTNPARVVFDIPNTIVNNDILNNEIKIGQDTVKVGQFDSNKARIVITSGELEKYFPIFSSDGQSIIFMNTEKFDVTSLFSKTNDALSYYVKKTDANTTEFIIAFNAPLVHSIRRDSSKLTVNLYNTLRYNENTFKNSIARTNLENMQIELLQGVGLKLIIPLQKDALLNCYLGSDGKSFRFTLKGSKISSELYKQSRVVILPKFDGKKKVVIDPGHGGSDYGAIRCGINEKDINFDIAKRVQAILSSKGISVTMTRVTDDFISLQDRTNFCAEICPDIFVSIHVNSSSKEGISGIETHYYHQESIELAQTVHSCMISQIKAKDRGLFKSKFYVINHTEVPSVLLEIGFLSNNQERAELVCEERKQQTAKAIADGIIKYLNKYK